MSLEQQVVVSNWEKIIGSEVPRCFKNGEFLKLFQSYVPAEEQLKFVQNTAYYSEKRKDVNVNYVLYFRRSIPGDEPKPEIFWTNNFWTVFNGLSRELPHNSPRRIYSEIFVVTKSILDKHNATDTELEDIDKKYGSGSSDGEMRISPKPFAIKNCLFTYKPERELTKLNEYQKSPNFLTREQVLEKIANAHIQADLNIKDRQL